MLDLGCGTGRVALDLAGRRPRRDRPRLRAELARRARLAARARSAGCGCAAASADARSVRARAGRSRSRIAPMQVVQLLGGASAAARDWLRCVAATWRRGGLLRGRARRPVRGRRPTSDACRRCPTSREEDGWVYSSTPSPCGAERRRRRDRAAAPGGVPARASSPSRVARDQARPGRARASSRRRPRRLGYRVRARRSVPETDGLRRQHVVMLEAVDADAARLRALPGADEHLRRPRQHRGAARPLRVARNRLRARRGAASARRSTPTRTTSSTWAAARTATRRCARRTWSTTKRDALHAAADRGAVVLAVCGGYQLLGHALRDGRRGAAGRRARRPAHRARAGAAADRQLRDRGRPRHGGPRVIAGFENHGGRTYLGAGRAAARPRAQGLRQQRQRRLTRACSAAT